MPTPTATRRLLSAALPPLLLSVVAAVTLACVCGGTVGVFIGSVLVVTLLVPPTILASSHLPHRLLALLLSVIPLGVVWLITAGQTKTSLGEWGSSTTVLVSYAVALAGLAVVIRAARLSVTVSAAMTVVLGLVWLTWPIWLSRAWDGEASAIWVNRLVTVHPVLAVSLSHLGQWPEQTVAYHLTELNQSVPYAPPRTVWVCVAVYLIFGVAVIGLVGLRGYRARG